MGTNTALVVIDMQVGLIEPAYRGKEVLDGFRTDEHVIRVKPADEVVF